MSFRPLYVFDLDGTLSDPALGIGRSLDHALVAHGFAPLEPGAVSHYIGPPLDEAFAELTGSRDARLLASLVASYRERYADVGYSENVLYPGIPDALARLAEHGPLALCTSKRAEFAQRILRLFDLDRFFDVVSGGDVGVAKRSQLADLLRSQRISERAMMIGDRALDIHAARDNALHAVGVLWGHGSHDELRAAAADRLLAAPAELMELCQ